MEIEEIGDNRVSCSAYNPFVCSASNFFLGSLWRGSALQGNMRESNNNKHVNYYHYNNNKHVNYYHYNNNKHVNYHYYYNYN